jgi:hypothetical protein
LGVYGETEIRMHSIQTQLRDAILANCSAGLDADAVQAVEWAAIDDTRRALYTGRFPAWETVDPRNWRA